MQTVVNNNAYLEMDINENPLRDEIFTEKIKIVDGKILLNEKPGSYLYIGQNDNYHNAHLHTTQYDFNDNLLPLGVNYWIELVKKFFQK